MKQAEKSKLTYDKIMNASIVEFGTKSYGNASLNNICANNNISKGLIYHNFKSKDDLYLQCVQLCFTEILTFLNQEAYNEKTSSENIKKLMDLRYRFFQNHPYFGNIFLNAVIQPPGHLVNDIKKIREEFDQFNLQQYQRVIKNIHLREGVTESEALECFFLLGEMFHGYFASKTYENSDAKALIRDHEIQLSKILKIMLYGIAKEE